MYTTTEVAFVFGVCTATVLRWIAAGQMNARKQGRGRWLVSREEIERFEREEGSVIIAPLPVAEG